MSPRCGVLDERLGVPCRGVGDHVRSPAEPAVGDRHAGSGLQERQRGAIISHVEDWTMRRGGTLERRGCRCPLRHAGRLHGLTGQWTHFSGACPADGASRSASVVALEPSV